MAAVVKLVLIATVLVIICVAILAAARSYGVWVITGIAGVLFLLGLLRKEKSPGKRGETQDDGDERRG